MRELKVKVTDIDWDTSDTNYDTEDEIELSTELDIIVTENDVEDLTDLVAVDEFISDEISNIVGFCHNGYVSNIA